MFHEPERRVVIIWSIIHSYSVGGDGLMHDSEDTSHVRSAAVLFSSFGLDLVKRDGKERQVKRTEGSWKKEKRKGDRQTGNMVII